MNKTTVQQAAQILGLTPGAVRGLLATGYLKGEKVDRVWNVSVESLQVLQALLRLPLRAAPQVPTLSQSVAIARHLCPVCAGGRWGAAQQGSEWSHEFMECQDCAFTVHTSFLDLPDCERVRQRVQDHLHLLVGLVRQGENARECLQRRALALHSLES
ncbi:helix-turn-helix domain-containing protein [bacterium]|nr:helix-turn-helix domain-containing protein [bacterium]